MRRVGALAAVALALAGIVIWRAPAAAADHGTHMHAQSIRCVGTPNLSTATNTLVYAYNCNDGTGDDVFHDDAGGAWRFSTVHAYYNHGGYRGTMAHAEVVAPTAYAHGADAIWCSRMFGSSTTQLSEGMRFDNGVITNYDGETNSGNYCDYVTAGFLENGGTGPRIWLEEAGVTTVDVTMEWMWFCKGSLTTCRYTDPPPPPLIRRPARELYGHRLSSAYAGDPVNTATGNLTESFVDVDFPVDGLGWTRTYNSRNTGSGALGQGWSVGFGSSAAEDSTTGRVVVTDWDGRMAAFTPSASGGYDRPEEFFATLAKNGDGTFSLHYDEGRQEHFSTSGALVRRAGWDGQEVTLTYSGGLLTAAAHNADYALTFTYAGSLLTGVSSSDGRSVTYGYISGLLSSVTDPAGGVTAYEYDSAGRLKKATDPDGVVLFDNIYDTNGRVVSQMTPSGDVVSLAYNDPAGTTTVGHAGSGASTVYAHDAQGRVVSVTDPHGQTLSKSYDTAGNLTSVTDRRGGGVTQTFDAHGNVLTRSGPEGVAESFTYDGVDRMLTATNGEGETTTYTYEGSERSPATVTDANSKTTTYDVRADGLIGSVTDADGVTVTNSYDSARNLTATTDGAGKATTFGYGSAGNRTSIQTPLGRTTTSTYDGMRRVLSVTDDSGGTVSQVWTAGGRLATRTDAESHTTIYSYDTAGRPHTESDPLGNQTTYGYDLEGNLTSVSRPGSVTWSATYDRLGRRTSATDATGVTTTFAYDEGGNLTSTTDENGGVVSRMFDLRGRVLTVADQLGNATAYTYDAADRVMSETDALSNVTTYTYDDAGRLLTTTRPGNRTWSRTYTAAGRLTTETDPSAHTVTYGYDTLGRLAAVTNALGKATTYSYDDDGRAASITTPQGQTTTFGYDHLARTATETSPAGGATLRTYTSRGQLATLDEPATSPASFTYDAAGRLASATDALGAVATYGYDDRGNLITRANAAGKVESWAYDAADRLVSYTDPLGRTTANSYDSLGRLSTVTDASGRFTANTYDAAHRLTGHVSTLTGSPTVAATFSYDAAGRRTSMTDPSGTTAWSYSPMGEVTAITAAGKTLEFGYDPAGNRTTLTYPDTTVATFSYDPANRLTAVTHPASGSVIYTYDNDGRVLAEDLPGLDERTYGYDGAGRLASYSEVLGGETRTTTLGRDLADRVTSETKVAPGLLGPTSTNITYGYDGAGQLTSVSRADGPSTETTSYTYDALGRRTTKTAGAAVTTSTYDDASQLTSMSRTTSGVTTDAVAFSYDAAGRLSGAVSGGRSRTYTYNASGNLVSAEATSGTVSTTTTRVTNGDGHLVSISATTPTSTTTTSLTWDPTTTIPQAVTAATGGVDTNFLFGLGREIAIRGAQGDTFAYDVHGSTEARGEAADLARASGYDEFGVPAGATTLLDEAVGTAEQRLRLAYRGEISLDGLLHLRAREYAAGTGRFTSTDPVDGTPGTTTVASPYQYSGNDPVNRIDPLGLSWTDPCVGHLCASDIVGANLDVPSQWNGYFGAVGAAKVDAYTDWAGDSPRGLDLFNVALNPSYQRYADYHARYGESPDSLLDWINVGANPGYRAIDSCSKIGQGRWLDCTLSAAELVAAGVSGSSAARSALGSAPNTTRLAQDIRVSPMAPRALPLNRPVGASASQNQFVQSRIASLQGEGATAFRVNQQQINVNGVRVGINRPDLQYTLNGQRFYEEFDTLLSTRGPGHASRIGANDPFGIINLFTVG